ncbi:MAG: hypothetical protein H5T61_04805 [Thermoflexales bacterium]|nr:hypothetical protein [Thermoflexales bacterium]
MPSGKAPAGTKPFFWVPLSKQGPERDSPLTHDRFRDWSGRLELEIEVVSEYLYVGSGNFELFNLRGREQAYYAFARRDGQLVIPGTSIKGAVRSVVEAISNSCVRIVAGPTHERGKIIKPDERPLFEKRAKFGNWAGCKSTEELCPACRMFGATGYRGRVHFSDAVPVDDVQTTTIKIADLWPPRLFKERKFYQTKSFQQRDMTLDENYRFLEVVPQGTRFRIVLFFENTTTAEMGLLVRALGLDRHPQEEGKIICAFPIKIGGAKPYCLGSVCLIPKYLLTLSKRNLFQSLLKGGEQQDIEAQVLEWLDDKSLLDQEAWAEFQKGARPQRDIPCPKEVY